MLFNLLRRWSVTLSAMYLVRRMVTYTCDAMEAIESLEGFRGLAQGLRWSALIHLFSFSVHIVFRVLLDKYSDAKNTADIMREVEDKIIYFLAHFKRAHLPLPFQEFHEYIDGVFKRTSEGFYDLSLDPLEKNNVVWKLADDIATIYASGSVEKVRRIVGCLELRLIKLVTY